MTERKSEVDVLGISLLVGFSVLLGLIQATWLVNAYRLTSVS
jgi:hypothetical protein